MLEECDLEETHGMDSAGAGAEADHFEEHVVSGVQPGDGSLARCCAAHVKVLLDASMASHE
jgi:hypothetical protein